MVWKEASPFGIEKDAGQDAWYSGHVTDVIEQEDESLVIATETGGVWLVGANGSALPLSDSWDSPDVNCLARGPDGTRHYYAGANDGTIWQTDPAAGFPMFNWAPVVGTPAPQGSVRDLAVIPTLRLIVAACDQGMFWANIPPVATAPYIWREALYKDSIDPTGFFSVTMGLTDWPDRIPVTEGPDGFLLDQTHLDYVTVTAGGQSRGMFSGQWKGAPGTLRDLEFHRSVLYDQQGTDVTVLLDQTKYTAVDTCDGLPNAGFAVCGNAVGKGNIKLVAKTEDGGRTWRMCDARIGDRFLGDVAGEQPTWNCCVGAHPSNAFSLAVGWQTASYWSKDGGKTFAEVSPGSAHLHGDIHVLKHIRPNSSGNTKLYIGSDGGLAMNWLGTDQVRSDYNRNLRTLQMYSPDIRMFYGTLSAHPDPAQNGLVCTGTQDNGNVYCWPEPNLTPWRQIDGCDGGPNLFLASGQLVRNPMCGGDGNTLGWAKVEGTRLVDLGELGLLGSPPGLAVPKGPYGEAVIRPRYRNGARQLMEAVIGKGGDVFGVFTDQDDGGTVHLEFLLSLPVVAPAYITALGSYDGQSVLVGTSHGQMFVIDSASRTFLTLSVRLPAAGPLPPETGGAVTRIDQWAAGEALAVLNRTSLGNSYLLRLAGFSWAPTGTGLNTKESIFALAHDGQRPSRVFAATDSTVYSSDDRGATWRPWSEGLPRRPHCSDLRFSVIDGRPHLYLSTYGRSLWMRELDPVPAVVLSARSDVQSLEDLAGVSDYDHLDDLPVTDDWVRLAASLAVLAYAYRDTGQPAEATAAMNDRVKVFARLAAADPARFPASEALALVDMLDFRTGVLAPGAARTAASRAVVILEELAGIRPPGSPDAPDYDHLGAFTPNEYWPWPYLDRAVYYRAFTEREDGMPAEAAVTMGHRVKIYERLAAVDPAKYRINVGLALVDMLDFRTGVLAPGAARTAASRAVVILEEIAGIRPPDPDYDHLGAFTPSEYWPWPYLDRALYYRAFTEREDGMPAEAAVTMGHRVKVYERLAADDPAKYRVNVAVALVDMLDFRTALTPSAARTAASRAVVLLEEIAGIRPPGSPDAPDYDRLGAFTPNEYWPWPYLDRAVYYRAFTEREDGMPAEAAVTMGHRVKIYEQLCLIDPAKYRVNVAVALVDMLDFRTALTPSAARTAASRAVVLLEEIAGIRPPGSPDAPDYDRLGAFTPNEYWPWPYLDRALYYRAYTEREDGLPADAAESMAHRVKIYERLVQIDAAKYTEALANARTDADAFSNG